MIVIRIPKDLWSHRKFRITKAILKKKHKALSIRPLDFKVYYKATVIKMHGFGIKIDNRPMAQNEESRIKLPHVYMVN